MVLVGESVRRAEQGVIDLDASGLGSELHAATHGLPPSRYLELKHKNTRGRVKYDVPFLSPEEDDVGTLRSFVTPAFQHVVSRVLEKWIVGGKDFDWAPLGEQQQLTGRFPLEDVVVHVERNLHPWDWELGRLFADPFDGIPPLGGGQLFPDERPRGPEDLLRRLFDLPAFTHTVLVGTSEEALLLV